MNKVADKTSTPHSGQQASLNATTMFLMIADTTARLFVPTIGGTILGLWADHTWGTKPWMTITGVVFGAVIAFLLVNAQLRSIKMADKKERL